jgi:GntR family transcriptional regulator
MELGSKNMKLEQKANPLYQAVSEAILRQVKSGELKPNDRLPSENELCEIYSVGRNTIRRALSELVDDGYLKTIAGLGTFVEDNRLLKTAECSSTRKKSPARCWRPN